MSVGRDGMEGIRANRVCRCLTTTGKDVTQEQKNVIALNEMNSNKEPTDGGRLIHIELSRTRVLRIYACIWNSG